MALSNVLVLISNRRRLYFGKYPCHYTCFLQKNSSFSGRVLFALRRVRTIVIRKPLVSLEHELRLCCLNVKGEHFKDSI